MKSIEQQRQLLKKVFSPTSPIKEENFFRGRIEQLERIVQVMNEDGQHVIIYGERGVGKTSMANISQKHITHLYSVKVTCSSSDLFKTLWERALVKVRLSTTITGIGFKPEQIEEMFNLSSSISDLEEVQPHHIDLCLSNFPTKSFLFIFDEFDNIKDETTRIKFADLIKSLSDNSTNIKIMIVGIADNVTNLIGSHKSLERCLMQIKMPRMSENELEEIIIKGCHELEIDMTRQVQKRIIRFSSGFPHYTHLLCKYAIKNTLDTNTYKVRTKNLNHAIENAVENSNEQLRSSFQSAVLGESGEKIWRKAVYACATCYFDQFNSFTVDDVISEFNSVNNTRMQVFDMLEIMTALCEQERGFMLEKIIHPNVTRFKFFNPMMKPYILLNMEN